MSWDDPARELRRWIAAFDELAAGTVQESLATKLAARGQELLLFTWSQRQAPSGAAWAAPARNYGHPLLDDTGAMRSSARVEVGPRIDASGFSLTFTIADPKAIWHQYGTQRGGPTTSPIRAQNRKSFRAGESERMHIPARPMLFTDESDAALWIADLQETAVAHFGAWLTARFT